MRLFDFFDYNAREFGDVVYAIQGNKALTYHQALLAINQFANTCISNGLQVGDRIAILSKNSIEYLLFYYAAGKAGLAPVPLNFRLAPREWVYIINDSGAKVVFASAAYIDAIDEIRSELKNVDTFVAIESPEKEGWKDYYKWLEGHSTKAPKLNVEHSFDAYQMYTSGTTGHPKGAVISHNAVSHNVIQTSAFLECQRGEKFLIVAPLYHAAAAVSSFICAFKGSTIYLQEDFNPGDVVKAIVQEKIIHATLVPAMIQACLVYVPNIAQYDFSNLRYIAYGASPISENTLKTAMQVFKCDFIQVYGMTEATVALTALLAEPHRMALQGKPQLLLSAGRPIPGTEIRIVDLDDNDVPIGTTGEIIARGPQLMKGYWNKPEATEETLRNGWLHTGDAGYIDEDGFLYVQDRVKDMIVSGGENVYPRAIEDVLYQHPAIADAAVIGVPDEKWGETIKALVVLRKDQTITSEDLINYCRTRLGGFECPTSVDFIEALPRNPSGKVLKRQLREPYWAGYKRRVS
jgi:acyl-CoA synthetase (AMP-forming)/AMP-acid ligase II